MNLNKRKHAWGRWLSLSLCAALLLPLASESEGTAWAEPAKAPTEQRVLRIGSMWSGEDDSYFRQQFTDLYEFKHPEIKLEIIPAINVNDLRFSSPYPQPAADSFESIRALMGGDQPVDVIVADNTLLKSLAGHNLLQPLQPLIDRDHYDLSTMAPTMLEGIRDLGRGHLFALAPTFTSSALYYNKGIFDAAGVPYPSDGMSWNEMFALADKVTKVSKKKESRVYGFSMSRYMGDPFWNLNTFLSPLELNMYDNKGDKMTVNTSQWSKFWSMYTGLVKKQTVPGFDDTEYTGYGEYSPVQGDLFLTGKTAMVVGEYGYINELVAVQRNASKIKNYKSVDWDIVSMPTFPEQPGVAVGTWLGNMMAISSTATNPEDAWNLIKFVNSSEVAKIKAHNRNELTSRTEYITSEVPSLNLEPFYSMKPMPANDPSRDRLLSDKPGLYQISDAGHQLFIEVYKEKMTVEHALKIWEKQGNIMLNKLKKDPMASFNLEDDWIQKSTVR